MPSGLLIDTSILVDYLRDKKKAKVFLERQDQPLMISSITVAELYAGVREGKERVLLDEFLQAFQIIVVDLEIANQGGLYRRDYGKSHGVGLLDAIIAASANKMKAILVTLNKKHFPMLKHIKVPY